MVDFYSGFVKIKKSFQNKTKKKKIFDQYFDGRERSFNSFLPYIGFVDPSIIFLKNKGLFTSFRFRGSDLSTNSVEKLSQISMIVNDAFSKFGTGWMLHVDVIRESVSFYPDVKDCYFKEPVSDLIDSYRRYEFERDQNTFDEVYYLNLTYTPPLSIGGKIESAFRINKEVEENKQNNTEKKNSESESKKYLNDLLIHFKEEVTRFKMAISSVIDLKELGSDEMVTYLHRCVTGLKHPVCVPVIPFYLDHLVAPKNFLGGSYPKAGNKHIQTISVRSFPSYLYSNFLSCLSDLCFEFRLSTRFIFMDQAESEKFIKDVQNEWYQSQSSFSALIRQRMGSTNANYVNEYAFKMANDAQMALESITSSRGQIKFGFYTATVVLMHEDEVLLKKQASIFEKALQEIGIPAALEVINSVEAFLGSLPGVGFANVRRPLITTHNLTHMLPLSAIWRGDATHPSDKYINKVTKKAPPPLMYTLTNGRTPFGLSLFVKDVGNVLVIGPAGSGKTTLLNMILSQHFRFQNARVFYFDKDYSAYVNAKAMDGAHFDFGAEKSQVTLCPIFHIDTAPERAEAKLWIQCLVELQFNRPATPNEMTSISEAVDSFAKAYDIHSGRRTLEAFLQTIQDEEVRKAIKPYVTDFGYIFNGSKNSIPNNKLCVFEMNKLFGLTDKVVYPALTNLFSVIERCLSEEDFAPTTIILDEAWLFLENERFISKIGEWLRTLRKKNCNVIFATQSIADIANSKIYVQLIQECKTKIFLPNNTLRNNESDPIHKAYTLAGLNSRDIEIVISATEKRDYYLLSGNNRRLFQLALDKIALAFVGSSGSETNIANAFMEKYGKDWTEEWLIFKGVDKEWIDYFRFLKKEYSGEYTRDIIKDYVNAKNKMSSESEKNDVQKVDPVFIEKLMSLSSEPILN